MSILKPLLTKRECLAYRALTTASVPYSVMVLPKVGVADIADLSDITLSQRERAYASQARFDFVLGRIHAADLIIDCDFLSESSRHKTTLSHAALKDHICNTLGLTCVRLDCSDLRTEDIEIVMEEIMDTAFSSEESGDFDFVYTDCLLHGRDCSPSQCDELAKIVAEILTLRGYVNINRSSKADVRTSSHSYHGRICTRTSVAIDGKETHLGLGICRVTGGADPIGLRISKRLAMLDASYRLNTLRTELLPPVQSGAAA